MLKKLYEPLYKLKFHCYIGEEPTGLLINNDNDDGTTWKKRGIIYMWVRRKNDYPSLAHECIHAANYGLKARGVKISTSNDETLAYLVEWLFERCMK